MNVKNNKKQNDNYLLKLPDIKDRYGNNIDHNNKILLHSCCAPCSCDLLKRMIDSDIDVTIFFYNPNIHPKREYEIRKEENIKFAEKYNINFIDADYDIVNWLEAVKGLENEPERGKRCDKCFDIRLERTAQYAFNNNFNIISTSLGISRWKNMEQINFWGKKAANKYENIFYFDYNWRKAGGSSRMYEISKEENFYMQEYCGCIYSLKDSNKWRLKNGRDKIEIGKNFY